MRKQQAARPNKGALNADEAINQAVLDNNADALAPLLAGDWIEVAADGEIGHRDDFVESIKQKYFVHKTWCFQIGSCASMGTLRS